MIVVWKLLHDSKTIAYVMILGQDESIKAYALLPSCDGVGSEKRIPIQKPESDADGRTMHRCISVVAPSSGHTKG
jgi:hypothetical protein